MTQTTPRPGRRIGELASASGMTVRALHHYEDIGLLVASERTDAGHRMYSDIDVARLYRISLLRQLGLQLSEVGSALDDPAWDLGSALRAHRDQLERRLENERRLHARLSHVLSTLASTTSDAADALIAILEDMTMLDSAVQRRISTLVYSDIESAFDYLERVFGLGPGHVSRDSEGEAVHGELHAGDGLVWLHPESAEFSLSSPQRLGAGTSVLAIIVDDVDEHHQRAEREGADIVYPPMDQPYGYREYGVRDLEGHLWSFMRQLD